MSKIQFFDGGMGTLLQERGLLPGEAPENWNITHPDQITAIHRAYFEAGANVVVAGSAVFKATNPAEAVKSMQIEC